MRMRIGAVFLAFCLTLTLFPAIPAAATDAPVNADFANQSLEELLNQYFQTVLTRGIAEYDCDYEDFLTWMSETVLENAIIRVEALSEQEITVSQVSFVITDRNEETGALSADVTESVDGQSFATTHSLQVRDGRNGGGWFIESDSYFDAVLNSSGYEGASGSSRPTMGASVTPSQSHKHSYTNTGVQAEDIVNIALTQEGYAETGNNRTKYNVWYYGENKSAAWCAIYISWCANQAGIATSIIRKNALASGYSVKNMRRNSFGTASAYAFGDAAARPGDIAYIDNNNDNISNHVGLVYKTDSSYVYTIEGNFSNKVTKRKYSAKTGRVEGSSTRIVFYARPAYRGELTSNPNPGPSTLDIRPARETYRITQGAVCNIEGVISSNYLLTNVEAALDTGWSARIENVGKTVLNLEDSELNGFRGSELSVGNHTLTITATDASGKNVSESISIVVVPGMEITFSPASLTLNLGETKALSVSYSYTSDVKRIAWDSTAFHIVSFSEESKAVSAGNAWQLSVYGNREGTETVPFQLLDANGNALYTASIPVTVNKVPSSGSPPDVPEAAYYYASVLWAIANGVIVRFAQNFNPSEPCTRASAVTFLWRLAGAPAPSSSYNPFTDVVPTDSYYNAALWAVERGITKGTSSDKFSPTATCNRGQIVTFLHRYAGQPAGSGVNRFKDVPQGSFCYDSVNWAASNGIAQGFDGDVFRPRETCTRAHIITFIYRYAVMR